MIVFFHIVKVFKKKLKEKFIIMSHHSNLDTNKIIIIILNQKIMLLFLYQRECQVYLFKKYLKSKFIEFMLNENLKRKFWIIKY